MDKTAIKSFAINSRNKLMQDVRDQMYMLGITEEGIADSITNTKGIQTFQISSSETHSIYNKDIKKRESLVREVKAKGFENVVEEVAYTWFNRIIAIRFMEVNNYLPTKTRVLSSETPNKIEPDMVTEAFDLDLDYSEEDIKYIIKLKDENDEDKLFQFLFIKQCNKLNEILPGLFKKTEDYMELLLNISYTDGSIIYELLNSISEEDFEEQVEIIGWLYQYYNTDLKSDTDKNFKKVPKERVPSVTQLFTPDWIVKYMVENSLGRLWLEGHPNEELKSTWRYYVEEAEQDPEVELQLAEIRKDSKELRPEDIKIIDPCMGSGHILVYVFDVLMQIYLSEGYTQKEATMSIFENNLYGLDIDDRAYQFAYFAVMMKARKYNRKIFSNNINPMLFSIKESNLISKELIDFIIFNNPEIKLDLEYLLNSFIDAKEFGSILKINEDIDFESIINILLNMLEDKSNFLMYIKYYKEIESLIQITNQAQLLSQKYDLVITNPPYMGNQKMSVKLKKYLKKEFPFSDKDIYASFIERGFNFIKLNGFNCMVTMHSWMFTVVYEQLRRYILDNFSIINLLHLKEKVMISFPTSATVFRKSSISQYNGSYTSINFHELNNDKYEVISLNNTYIVNFDTFNKIPRNPLAYWINEELLHTFSSCKSLSEYGDLKIGLSTSDNSRFLRLWHEVDLNKCDFRLLESKNNSSFKWFPLNKGGGFRKWYGSQNYVINWENNGYELKNFKKSVLRNQQYYFKESLSWSKISKKIAFKYYPPGFLFDPVGSSLFVKEISKDYIIGFLNSKVSQNIVDLFASSSSFTLSDLAVLPIKIADENLVSELSIKNKRIAEEDWNDYETSWNFSKHSFLRFQGNLLENVFNHWKNYKQEHFNLMKYNEEKLNEFFSELYSVNVDCSVEDKYVSVSLADYVSDVKSFISYAVGCMFGRYSLDEEGLQFAGGNFDLSNYSKFVPDDDNIIPVLDTEYFEDDIVGRFVEFVKVCFGEENLEENLDFIAKALSNKNKTSREIIREYLLKNFFKDHVQTYKKTPIYWMFTSGKQNGFNCLVYMHRYTPDLVARVRTDYLHKTQKAIEERIIQCDNIIESNSSNTEKKKATKDKIKLEKQLKETRDYDDALEIIANQKIEIDLDDGVKVNYAKFQNVEINKDSNNSKNMNLLKKI